MAAEGIEKHALTVLVGLVVTGLAGGSWKILRKMWSWFQWVNRTVEADHEAVQTMSAQVQTDHAAVQKLEAAMTEFQGTAQRIEHAAETAVQEIRESMQCHLTSLHQRLDGFMLTMVERNRP